ncbi:unnamed protein product [Echinostoma caproni]|uniref:Secreted protein n=1 Tax=Echinostoma caproni TaxID=27848 RepID=A0A3P8HKB2_9TREM|nr:unnamed protein product [Echinostoma caproni]
MIGAVALFISLSTIALLLVACFWWVGGFDRPVEHSAETENEEDGVNTGDNESGDTHPVGRTGFTRRADQLPHEAGDDGGAHRSRKPKHD